MYVRLTDLVIDFEMGVREGCDGLEENILRKRVDLDIQLRGRQEDRE